MEFVNPGFLFGLLAVSIPVIIHLFNFRRFRKVYFTNVAFIKELKQETQKQSKLKHLLVLLARMLAIAALVIAFARPYIPAVNSPVQSQGNNAVSIYIDNSFSMQAESENGSLLDEAKEKAGEIARVYKSSDRLQILTNDFEGRHQRLISRDEYPQWLDEVEVSPVVRSVSEVMNRQNDILNESPAKVKTAYIISDFQEGFLNTLNNSTDSTTNFYLIPIQSTAVDNLYIDSVWFESPVQQRDQLVELKVRITNSGENDLEKIPVKLTINNLQKSLASLDIFAGETKELTLPFTNPGAGIQLGKLELNDHPVSFDDTFYFSYKVAPLIKILCINGKEPNPYLNSFFVHDSTFQFENVNENRVDYSAIKDFDMVLLNEPGNIASGLSQTLLKFIENGGSVALIPAWNVSTDIYNGFLSEAGPGRFISKDTVNFRINYINLKHPLFTDVFDEVPENIDLPLILESYNINYPSRSNHDVLLGMQNGNPFLSIEKIGKGKLYLYAAPFTKEAGNFVRHAIFVPTLYKMAINSISVGKLFYTLGKEEMIRVEGYETGSEEPLKIKADGRDFEIIPENRYLTGGLEILTHDQIKTAGNYLLMHNDEALMGLSFNYDRSESEMKFKTPDEIENWIADQRLNNVHLFRMSDKPFSQTINELNQGTQLWKWFILAALFLLLLEVLLLRFLSN